ncbi:MAG: precorrin-8X methylmutase, partial [Alphaproteobacteria bacterium]|nr:precorrin-8X methylmutase [Alphaproteobacteria bacterium]
LAEVYPSVLRKEVEMRKRAEEILDCAQVRINASSFARLDGSGDLAPLFKGMCGLLTDERYAIVKEEGWILGLGHEDRCENRLL